MSALEIGVTVVLIGAFLGFMFIGRNRRPDQSKQESRHLA